MLPHAGEHSGLVEAKLRSQGESLATKLEDMAGAQDIVQDVWGLLTTISIVSPSRMFPKRKFTDMELPTY